MDLTTDETIEVNGSASPSTASRHVPVVWAPAALTPEQKTPPTTALTAIVRGRVVYDAVLDCFLLQNGDPPNVESVPVVWPAGSVGTDDGPGVVLPGQSVARVGVVVSGGGGYLKVADDYNVPTGCRVPSGDVAVFNPGEAVTIGD